MFNSKQRPIVYFILSRTRSRTSFNAYRAHKKHNESKWDLKKNGGRVTGHRGTRLNQGEL